MKNWKRVLSLLLTLVLLTGCSSVGQTPTDPTGSGGPQRPGDPGVIAPVGGEDEIPEDGVLWDMEALPDTLSDTPWAVAKYSDEGDYVAGRVQFFGVDGKGYAGSRALAIRQNQKYNWSDIYTIGYAKDETAVEKWTFGDMLWIWYDSTEISGPMMLELKLNGANMQMGLPYYTMEDGGTEAKRAGILPEGWTGAGYGRIPLTGGGKFWVGVPMEAFGEERRITSMEVHLAGNAMNNISSPVNLYLDQFVLTAADEGPLGASLSTVSVKQATSDAPAWTMDDLPDDLLAAYWASHDGAGWDTYVPGNIRVLGVDGKGVNGSRALQVKQMGKYNGADVFSVNMTSDPAALTDWTGQTVLWFYADTTELNTDLMMDISIDGHKAAIGAPYYGINEDGKQEQAGTLELAWTGANYGRMRIGNGYAGWVGIALESFGANITEAANVTLHLAYSGSASANVGRSTYLDEIWVLKDGELPKDAKGADIKLLTGKPGTGSGETSSDDGIDPGPAGKLPQEMWSMEKLPENVLNGSLGYATYADNADYKAGNVTMTRADGKGVDGSAALALTHVGSYSWADAFTLNLTKDSTAVRNWVCGKYIWFWADTTEYTDPVNIDLWYNQAKPKTGSVYYLLPDGATSEISKIASEAYTGAGFARLSIPGGFSGWVGIATQDYTPWTAKANNIAIHTSPQGSDYQGNTLYLDSFWLTIDPISPTGVEITPVSTEIKPATSDAPVWDMEKLPDDPESESWVEAEYSTNNDFVPGNFALLGVDGKGRGGSRAMKVAFNGPYSWADVRKVNISSDLTAATDWTDGEMLWMYVNGSELKGDVEMELVLNKVKANASAGLFTVVDGAVMKKGELIVSWDGSGRIPVEKGYVGWLGIPLSAYAGVEQINGVDLHFGGSISAGSALYLDELWVTKLNEVPVDAENAYYEFAVQEPESVRTQIWSFDDLSESWKTNVVTGDGAAVGDYVDAVALDGWGINGSTALGYVHKGSAWNVWSYYLDFAHADRAGMAFDWSGAETVWFWMDASRAKNNFQLDVKFDGKGPKAGAEYLVWSGSGEATVGGTLPEAWNGAGYGRFTLPAGFSGYIGLKVEDFTNLNIGAVYSAYLYITNSATNDPAVILFDDFWLTSGDLLPDPTASQPSGTTSPDPLAPGPVTTAKPEEVEKATVVWDMENVPDDAKTLAMDRWGDYPSVSAGTMTVSGVDGKGVDGSRALGVAQTENQWYHYLYMVLGNDSTAVTDWSGSTDLYFYVNASEFDQGSYVDVFLHAGGGEYEMKAGAPFYTWQNGNWTENTTNEYKHMSLPAGFTGWVRLPIAEVFGTPDLSKVERIGFYREYYGSTGSIYFDNFCVGSTATEEPAGTRTQIWSLDNLPSGWKDKVSTYDANVGDHVDAVALDGWGVNGSTALGYVHKESAWNVWSYALIFSNTDQIGMAYDWTGAETVWFWIDASRVKNSFQMDVKFDGKGPKTGAEYLVWSGSGEPAVGGTLPEAWNGAGYGRFTLPAGFSGYIGLKVADFTDLNIGAVYSAYLYITNSATNDPAVILFDDFWLTSGDMLPDPTASQPSGSVSEDPTPAYGTSTVIWNFEALPDDMSSQVTTGWGSQTLGEHVDAVKAAGKGMGGSTAFGYKSLEASWDGNYILQMDHADQMGMNPDWSGAEMLWIWVDASEMTAQIQLDLQFNWCKPVSGAEYWIYTGGTSATKAGTLPEAYTGAGYGRFPVDAGFKGYIGVKVSDYSGLSSSGIYSVLMYYASGNLSTIPATLYLDNFTITSGNALPGA